MFVSSVATAVDVAAVLLFTFVLFPPFSHNSPALQQERKKLLPVRFKMQEEFTFLSVRLHVSTVFFSSLCEKVPRKFGPSLEQRNGTVSIQLSHMLVCVRMNVSYVLLRSFHIIAAPDGRFSEFSSFFPLRGACYFEL